MFNISARVLMLLVTATPFAVATPWQQNLDFELLFSQGYYSSNWLGEERTSGSATAGLNHRANNQLAPIIRFEHELGLAFGQQVTQTESAETTVWTSIKSEDKIKLDEALRFTLGAWLDPILRLEAKSQFIDGRISPRTFFNPLELFEAAGGGRRFYDDSTRMLTSELGIAFRQYWGRTSLDSLRADAGFKWTSAYRTRFFSPLASFATRLTFYEPLFKIGGETELNRKPEIDWESELSVRFGRALSGRVAIQLLSDSRAPQPRIKQILGLGLSLAWPQTN